MQHQINDAEEWKPLFGYDGRYEISNFGQIINVKRSRKPKLIPQISKPYGHQYVQIIGIDNIRKKKFIHTAVLETFGIQRPNGMECRHLDGNSGNNHISNLKWGTHKDNVQDSIIHGTFHYAGKAGENNANSVLKERQVVEIKNLFKNSIFTNKIIADKYNVTAAAINRIRVGKNWKHINI